MVTDAQSREMFEKVQRGEVTFVQFLEWIESVCDDAFSDGMAGAW